MLISQVESSLGIRQTCRVTGLVQSEFPDSMSACQSRRQKRIDHSEAKQTVNEACQNSAQTIEAELGLDDLYLPWSLQNACC